MNCPRSLSLVAILSVALLAGLITGCNQNKTPGSVRLENIQIETLFTKTEDGWNLQIDHFLPPQPDPQADPVILCHGLSYNNRFWDLTTGTSLARYLAARGFDVWSVSLRGAGLSDQPLGNVVRKIGTGAIRSDFFTSATKRKLAGKTFANYSVDDHINYDVPAVINLVKQKTGAAKVHWLGHSMGGMILFAYLETHPQNAADIHTFVAVSVPMVLTPPLNKAMQLQVDNAAALKAGNAVISTTYDSLIAKVLGKLAPPTASESLFLNRDNVDDRTLRLLAQLAQESISTQQLDQLLTMAAEENFYSLDKKINYTVLLDRIDTPTFFLVGQLDNMAPVGAVKYAYHQISSQDKDFQMFARINGHRDDYGHDDIIIGKHAQQEVFPQIAKWLNAH